MGKYDGYHTAYVAEQFKLPALERADFPDGVAIRNDIMIGDLPNEFAKCDCLYSELPWRKGFYEFDKRAGIWGRDYSDFLAAVRRHIEAGNKPAVIVTGVHAVKRLAPHMICETQLNGENMLALVWNMRVPVSGDTHRVLQTLTENFDCIGDFCCGYGGTGMAARRAGKQFVMSDHNGSCIRYVADKLGPVEALAA